MTGCCAVTLRHGVCSNLPGIIVRVVGNLLVLLALVVLGGCPTARESAFGADNDPDDGASGGAPRGCSRDYECVLAATTCCDCPAFAVSTSDPTVRACKDVQCPMPSFCPENVEAQCNGGQCELACVQLACNLSCADGFAIDETTGCLACACASVPQGGCTADNQCVATREDCCGCHAGGSDTAVLASERASYDAALGCPSSPSCPAVDICEPGAAPRCVQGRCELIAPNSQLTATCGRTDLPACPAGQVCTINRDPAASDLGLGVCIPEPSP
jgi:hypothetical protein